MRHTHKPLQRSSRKSTQKQNLTYIVLILLLIIFLGTVGVQLVIKTSLLISGVSKEDVANSQKQDDEYILTPELYDLPDATNSAQLKIFGSVTKDMKVSLFVNDEEIDSFTADSEEFEKFVTLKKGENTLYLEIEDPESKKIKDSETYKVLYLQGKPSLTINSPSDGQTVSNQEVTVDGKTDASVAIRIQGAPVVVGIDGSFKHSVRLKDGDNNLLIEATDIAGNQEKVEMTIKYQKDE